jgi:hypothetical protein
MGEGEDLVERGRDPLTQPGDDREGKVVELGFAHHVAIYGDGDGAHSDILHAGEGVQHSRAAPSCAGRGTRCGTFKA